MIGYKFIKEEYKMIGKWRKAQKRIVPKYLFAWLLSIALLSSLTFVPAAVGMEVEKEADILYKALQADEKILLSQANASDKTEENAYKIQALLFKKLMDSASDSVAGYKAGLTTQAQIERFKAPAPASSPLRKSGLIEIPDAAKPFTLKVFPGIMLETEFAFKTAAAIEVPVKDEETLKKLSKSVHPAIEVPQLNFADMANLAFFDLTAAGVGSRQFVIGPAQDTKLDFDSMQVVLSCNGTVLNEGKGAAA